MTRVLMNYVANPPSSERQRDQGKDQGCVPQAHGLASLTNKMCEATRSMIIRPEVGLQCQRRERFFAHGPPQRSRPMVGVGVGPARSGRGVFG